jgi:hypothetical protein
MAKYFDLPLPPEWLTHIVGDLFIETPLTQPNPFVFGTRAVGRYAKADCDCARAENKKN